MITRNLARFILGIGVAALFAGCGVLQPGQADTQPPIGAPPRHATSLLQSSPQTPRNALAFRIVYRFKRGRDAQVPMADLIAVNGVLYGTTAGGGEYGCDGGGGCGAAFKVTLSGSQVSESVIYSASEGSAPEAALLAVGGVLYGTTQYGGQNSCYYSCGTLFSLTPSGSGYAPSILHDFQSNSGSNPTAPLIEVGGELYGTASGGGSENGGVVYELSKAGSKYRVIYSFEGGQDGSNPLGGLVDLNGSLYGTTAMGGSADAGVVYELEKRAGGYKERVVYSFKGGKDGSYPDAALIALRGALYGTTSAGGDNGCGGCGTVFKLTPVTSGYSESIIYRFHGSPDGSYPDSALTALGDRLYGTTVLGGKVSCVSGRGCGTVFELIPSGGDYKERVLHRFAGGSGGYSPEAGLTPVNGSLYGTTAFGGNLKCNHRGGCGIIFLVGP